VILSLGSHTKCITKVLWSGCGNIYTASEDTTIKVWDKSGKLRKEFKNHGHWVNFLKY